MSTPETVLGQRPSAGWDQGLYRLGRSATIALVVLIVLLLAAGGLLAGALVGGEPDLTRSGPEGEPGTTTGSGFITGDVGAAYGMWGSGGALASGSHRLRGQWPVTGNRPDAILALELSQVQPSPVGPGGETPAGEDVVTIGPDVTVPVPPDWSVLFEAEDRVGMVNTVDGDYVFAIVGQGDPAADAAAIVDGNFGTFVADNEAIAELQTSEITTLDPFGSMVSRARIAYNATYADSQASYTASGLFFANVRQDGLILVFLVEVYEVTSEEQWIEHIAHWGPAYDGAVQSYAGAPFPTG